MRAGAIGGLAPALLVCSGPVTCRAVARRFDTVTLLTDLGTADESVGVLRCIVRDLAPHAAIVDLGHEVGPGDVRGASLMLARAVSYAPSGVIAVCVDAGVRAARRCVAVQVAGGEGVLVGPDSGVLAPAVAMAGGAESAVVLDRSDYHLASPGAPWPGRDVIVPVAAHLCLGAALDDVGTPVDPSMLLPGVVPLSRAEGDTIVADVLAVDRAGTCQLNVDPADLARFDGHLHLIAGEVRRVARVLGDDPDVALPAGALAVILDAHGTVSVLGGGRRAADELGLRPTDQLVLAPLDPADRPAPTVAGVQLRPSRPASGAR